MSTKSENLTQEDIRRMLSVGVDVKEESPRSGTFIQVDQRAQSSMSSQEDVEVMDIASALKKYDWLKDYWWTAVSPDKDEYTKAVSEVEPSGYFIRALPGSKTVLPVQACMYMRLEGETQKVHNIIMAEEGAELTIISGCATSTAGHSGTHIGITETYVKKNATLNFTMIHNWGPEVEVRPRSATWVEEGGTFISNYFSFRPIRMLQMYPSVYLRGKGATTTMNSVLAAPPGSHLDVGSRIYLQAEGARGESISRTITRGGDIISRGHLIGEVPGIRAHLECSGLILAERGLILAVPELEGHVDGVEMSHEAAVGKIAEDEVLYLMSRGLSRDEATSAIVRGFMRVELVGLPDKLKQQIDALSAKAASEGL